MKKLVIFMLFVLTFYCAFLTYQINEMKKGDYRDHQDTVTYVNKTVTGFSTDLSKVVEQISAQVVHLDVFFSSSTESFSGVIYSSDDHQTLIVANAQNLKNAAGLSVVFDNGESVNGTLLGIDELTDLALISTQPSFSSTPIVLGNSSSLSLGEWLIAAGSDIRNDYLPSVSVGVLSGKNRLFQSASSIKLQDELNVFVADLSIGDGIAGGAVVNMQGELMGIPSSALSKDGQCVIIPVEEVSEVVKQIAATGEVHRPVLGVSTLTVANMTAYQKSTLAVQLDQIEGLYVKSVAYGGPCDAAGILPGDILLEFNGSLLLDYDGLRTLLYAQKPQAQIELTVLRGADQMKVMVTLE